jgi:hypothetical protein
MSEMMSIQFHQKWSQIECDLAQRCTQANQVVNDAQLAEMLAVAKIDTLNGLSVWPSKVLYDLPSYLKFMRFLFNWVDYTSYLHDEYRRRARNIFRNASNNISKQIRVQEEGLLLEHKVTAITLKSQLECIIK